MNKVKQPAVRPLQKRFFRSIQEAVNYYEFFTGYRYDRAKGEAGIPWNIWPVEAGQYKFFIGTAKEWIEGNIDTSLN